MEIGVELTNRCNLKCFHCLRNREAGRADLSLAILEKLLIQAHAYRVKHIGFTGGEPTLHPGFEEIIDLTVSHDYTYHVVTNGWNFEEVFPLLMKHNRRRLLRGMSFSLDGASEDIHDRQRAPGSYRRLMKAISICHARGIEFSLQMSINRANRDEIEGLALLGGKLGATRVYFAYVQPTPELVEGDLLLSPEEQEEIRAVISRLATLLKVNLLISPGYRIDDTFFHCRALDMEMLTVDYRGNLVFCCQLSGYAGGGGNDDVIANLADTDLFTAHSLLVDRIASFYKERIRRIAAGNLHPLDQYPCFYCAGYFSKLGWLDKFPHNPWRRQTE